MGTLNRTVVAPLSSAIIAVLLAGVVVVGVDGARRNLQEGEARLQPTGVVEVAVDGLPFVRASRDRTLRRNDRIRVVEGKAVLELPRASVVELRDGSAVTLSGDRHAALVLDQGDLLVEAPHDTVKVDGGMAVASVAGSARLRRGVSLLAGVYEGNVNLQKNERSLGVPRYRQAAAVGTGLLPEAPDPLDLRASDEWDRRMLGEVLSLSEQLEIFGRSFEAQLPATGSKGVDLFKSVIPELADAPLTPQLLAGRAAGENLIGLSLVASDRGDFDARVRRVFGFRGAGASWGLVAADRDVNPNPLLGKLESAIERILPGGKTPGTPGAATATAAPARSRGTGTGSGSGSGTSAEELLAGALPANGAQPGQATPPLSTAPGGSNGTKPSHPANPANPSTPSTPTTTAPPPSTPPPSKKTVDVPPTGTALDPVLEPLVNPLENLLSGVLDTLTDKPATAPGTSTTVTAPASTTTTARVPAATTTTLPATTTTTTPARPPSGGLLGGLVGGLLKVVGGVL